MRMRSIRNLAVAVLTLLLIGSPAGHAQTPPSPAKMAQIQELMEVTQGASMSISVVEALSGQIMKQLTQLAPGMRPEHAQEIAGIITEEFRAHTGSLERLMTLIYDRHFNEEELGAAIAFYRTPVGKSLLAKMPLVFQESFALGQQWGAEIGRRAAERAVKRGRDLGYNL